MEEGFNHKSLAGASKKAAKFRTKTRITSATLVLGFVVGIMTGVFGAGGGGIILLILIFVLDFPIHTAIGTSSLLMVIATFSGTVGYVIHGSINPVAGLILGVSAAASGMASAGLASKVNDSILAKTVGIVFILLGIIMTALYI